MASTMMLLRSPGRRRGERLRRVVFRLVLEQKGEPRPLLRHGLAVVAVAVAAGTGWLLAPGRELQIALLQAAVALAVWLGGAAAGLIATALGAVATHLLLTISWSRVGLLGYLLPCAIIVVLGHALRAARRRAAACYEAQGRAERALHASEHESRTIFELASVGAAYIDPVTGRFVRVNRRLCEITGYTEAELLARTYSEITHPDDRQRHVEAIDEAEQRAWQIEKRYVRKDGSAVWVLVTGRMFPDSEGRPVRAPAIIVDVTARKQAEEAQRRSEARYRALVEAISNVIWTWDPETGQGDHGQAQAWWEEMTGQPVEAQRYVGWLEFVHPDDRARATAAWTGAMSGGAAYEVEYRIQTRTGEYRHMLSRAVPVHEPGTAVCEWVGMLADVTDAQRAKQALRHSEELLRLITDALPALIAYVDAEGRCRLANRAYERWFGVPPEQLCGRHAREVLGESSWRAVAPYLQRALAGEEIVFEAELEYPLVGRRWVRGTYAPDRAPDGSVRGLAVLISDITDHKQAEDALKEADRRKDEFLATLAHELRNPLAPIRSSLQLLKLPGADPAIQQRAREMMERQLHHLVRLVDDLLDVSRIMRGKIELRTGVVALEVVVARALETAQPLIEAQRHTLVLALPPRPLAVNADPIRLAQVVGNLLTNAAKYTEPGGHIWLSVERSGSDALVRVRDDGIGIAPDMQARIFDLFTQADHSTARAQGGLGIGLTLARNLIEMHHGSVEVRSEGLGTGTELIVRLPVLPDELVRPDEPAGAPPAGPERCAPGDPRPDDRVDGKPAESPSESPVERRSGTHGRILVVDDNTDAAEALAMLLELYGYELAVAGSGMAALDMIPRYRPDVIFLDIGMPGMDGYEVARRLRALPAGKSAYLIALTGWGQAEDRRRTREAGFDRHLIKPVAPDEVRALLAEVLESRRAAASTAAS
jgi:PAS domain S-box-containing protein